MNILSQTTKMPCKSFNHSKCLTGNKLRKNKKSVCYKCYAHKGFYCFAKNKECLREKTKLIENNLKVYECMLYDAIKTGAKQGFFRFHDAGDILSMDHLKAIINVCKKLDNTMFWIPTKEYKIIREYIKQGNIIPDNVTIRLSGYLIDKSPKLDKVLRGFSIASVYTKKENIPTGSKLCITNEKGNCGNCRACWDKTVNEIVYLLH